MSNLTDEVIAARPIPQIEGMDADKWYTKWHRSMTRAHGKGWSSKIATTPEEDQLMLKALQFATAAHAIKHFRGKTAPSVNPFSGTLSSLPDDNASEFSNPVPESRSRVMKVKRSEALAMFVEMGAESTEGWNDKRLQTKLSNVKDLMEQKDDPLKAPTSAPAKKLLKDVIAANAAEESFEIEDDDASDEKPAGKKKPGKKPAAKPAAGKTKSDAPAPAKKVGVIATIIECLKDGSAKSPVTKEEILAKLVKRFKERDAKSMMSTVHSQVPSGLKSEKGLIVKSNDQGYWLP